MPRVEALQLVELVERDLNIAVLYDESDRIHAKELKKHLEPLQGCATIWYADFRAGSNPQRELSHQIDTADLIVLLFSNDFKKTFGAHFDAMKLRRDDAVHNQTQIPVLLRSCDPPPEFDDLVWIPRTRSPLVSGDKTRDEDLQHVFDELASTVAEHLGLEYTSAESAKRRLRHLSRRVPQRGVGLRAPVASSTSVREDGHRQVAHREPSQSTSIKRPIMPSSASNESETSSRSDLSSAASTRSDIRRGARDMPAPPSTDKQSAAESSESDANESVQVGSNAVNRLRAAVSALLLLPEVIDNDELLNRAADMLDAKATDRDATVRSVEQAALRLLAVMERRGASYWWVLFAMFLLVCMSIIVAAALLKSALHT